MKQILILALTALPLLLGAANFYFLPSEVQQPDGSVLSLFASGDEYANRLHDAADYTVIQSPTDGYYYYAVRENGEPAPSDHRADSSDPAALGLTPGLNISPARYRAKVQAMNAHARSGSRGPNTGTVNNIVVYIRFSDQTEFEETRGAYDAKFNAVGDTAYSLRNYFHQASYDQLDYVSNHFPACLPDINLSYQDSHPRAYYMPYNSVTNPQGYRDWQRTDREHTLLANAIAAIADEVPATLNIDADNDQYVDNVCFIIRGPHTAWADLLWAHRWALYTVDSFINGKMVWDFTFQPEDQNSVRTLCHEMFHSVGAPDLYHYTFNGVTPAGCWDIMESGNGHMGMYMKQKYGGWINPIPVIGTGTYTLNPVTSATDNAYRINLTGNEYLVLEYRKRGSDLFEQDLPGSGLLIYRINTEYDGNSSGPPDEVYVYRPNGTTDVNGLIADAAFSADELRTEFNQYTNPACVLTFGGMGFSNIHSIGPAGDTITFTVGSAGDPLPPVIGTISPAEGEVVTPGPCAVTANVSAPSGSITQVQFYLDAELVATDTAAPYECLIPESLITPGYAHITVQAATDEGMDSSSQVTIRVVDPQQETWFNWMSADPAYASYGRGAVPIKGAVDFDLGNNEFLLKGVAFTVIPDPWGQPAVPGLVGVKINRFAGGAITEQTLLNLGEVMCSPGQAFSFDVDSDVVLSGQIAVILDLHEYQNLRFDTNGECGHSWFTEPDRPWTDAMGRGILGAADLSIRLQTPYVSSPDDLAPAAITGLSHYPNPFRSEASISFTLKQALPVKLDIYNLRGQKVRSLLDSGLAKGSHRAAWDGRDRDGKDLPSGIYLYRLQAGGKTLTGRMVRMK
jgi:M6 family metalloprotease-like protein